MHEFVQWVCPMIVYHECVPSVSMSHVCDDVDYDDDDDDINDNDNDGE